MSEGTFAAVREGAEREWRALMSGDPPVVMVGNATCGRSAGAEAVIDAVRACLEERGIPHVLVEVGCLGLCYAEPLMAVVKAPGVGVYYAGVTPERAVEIVSRWLVGDDPAAEYALGTFAPVRGNERRGEGNVPGNIPPLEEHPVLKPQVRRVLARCGFIDPTDIRHYIARGGYGGFVRALGKGTDEIIGELKASGLRGRGGAGFPTWRKWRFCIDAPGDEKYLVCNADEGDPGAFMNRSVLEGDPHAVIEGMLIGGYTLGARRGYIYCRAEYPLALERLRCAIARAGESGLLGDNILGSGFSFGIEIKEGAGAFVCGEETALIASMEGERGMPRPRPPFPAVSGLRGKPTVINNVETLANVSLVMRHGAGWFARCGTGRSKGTKTFALVGKVSRPGLVEVPLGITLREMIFGIGGGVPDGKAFKAVQTGGPSGGCIPAGKLDMPIDYESLGEVGAIMGSGGMVVMDEDTCMVDVARYFLDFTMRESCGKCVPCRLGTRQMLAVLEDITAGRGRPGDTDLLRRIGEAVKAGSLCGLGQTAPNPVLTTLRWFAGEYDAHIRRRACPARVCKALIRYRIDPERCRGCHACARACPVGAISGGKNETHVIDKDACIKCGLCYASCPERFAAVEIVSDGLVMEENRE